jgi:carboxymethylenebutenolidase
LELHVFSGVQHGFMMRGSPAFDQATRDFSMRRAFAILDRLREEGAEPRLRHAW